MTGSGALPKVELHCHLLGVISPALLKRIQSEGSPILVQPEALEAFYPVDSLEAFQRWVNFLKPYQSAPIETMRPLLAAHLAHLIEQDVVYTEIMVSPAMFPSEQGAFLAAVQRWREWTNELEQQRIQVDYLFVVPRTLDQSLLERDTERFLALKRLGLIAGVALVGVETGESIRRFSTAFARWRDAGLGIEIHAGENTGPAGVWDALEFGQPHRLGHAISSFEDPLLLDEIRSRGIHIEFCPTSNLCTGAVAALKQHPIGRAQANGLSFSLNTDDPGTFECSLDSEYEAVARQFSFKPDDFAAIFRNSLAARFEPRLRYLNLSPSQL